MNSKKIPRIAILVETSTFWGRQVFTGILNYDREFGPWHLFIEPRGIEESFSTPLDWSPDGVIARVSHPKMMTELKSLQVPLVNVSGINIPGADFPCVAVDHRAAGQIAAEYFLSRGYRQCGYYSILGLPYVSTQQQAFSAALEKEEANCSVYSVRPSHGAEPVWGAHQSDLIEWIKSLPKPVGILSWNASASRQVMYAAQEAGFLVPEDVAILSGTDDDLFCQAARIPLSGMRAPAEQIGYQAAQVLDGMMRGKSHPKKPILLSPLGVTTRQSTDTLAIQDAALQKAVRYIRANSNRNIDVREVVSHSGLSRRMMEIKFMTLLHRTPAEEIRRVHLERAKELLEQTNLPIPEVAEGSGFGSPERLAVVFKSAYGLSPLSYRKKNRCT